MNAGDVCTSKDVAPCSSVAQGCKSFDPPADKDFENMFPKAYAQVCLEPSSGDLCLYTDIIYKTCNEAKTSEFHINCLHAIGKELYMCAIMIILFMQ